jgi:hypothetical protein
MIITDQEIYDNRMKWIEYLKRPKTIKGIEELESYNNPECRCCLGHACHVLSPETRTLGKYRVLYGGQQSYLPEALVEALGLYSNSGDLNFGEIKIAGFPNKHNLADLNDSTDITPQEIGAYLESCVIGGDDTPFKKIDVELH